MTAYTIVRHKIRDFSPWKKVFDEFEPIRKKSGEGTAVVVQVEGDPNDIVVINTWSSIEAARAFFRTKELREAMRRAGVVGEPEIIFGEESLVPVHSSTEP